MTWKLHHLCVDCWSSPQNSPLLDIYISSKWLENCATAFLVFCSNSFRKVRNSNTFRVVGLVGSASEAVWISPSVSKLPNWEEHYVELMLERCLYSIIGCITIFISVVCMILYKPGSWYIKCCSQLRLKKNHFCCTSFSHELKPLYICVMTPCEELSLTYCDGSIWPRRTKGNRTHLKLWPSPSP